MPASPNRNGVEEHLASDIDGVVHFTTVDDFSDAYGDTSQIIIRITVESVP